MKKIAIIMLLICLIISISNIVAAEITVWYYAKCSYGETGPASSGTGPCEVCGSYPASPWCLGFCDYINCDFNCSPNQLEECACVIYGLY